jgi:hypothetical protein
MRRNGIIVTVFRVVNAVAVGGRGPYNFALVREAMTM